MYQGFQSIGPQIHYQGSLSVTRILFNLMFSFQKLENISESLVGLCVMIMLSPTNVLEFKLALTFGFTITFLQNEGQMTSWAAVQTKV